VIEAPAPGRIVPGAVRDADGSCRFSVWAPARDRVELCLLDPGRRVSIGARAKAGGGPGRTMKMARTDDGWHTTLVENATPGTLYQFRLDGALDRPDPASRSQPQGVLGPSAVVDTTFAWTDAAFRAPELRDTVLYEIHLGAFTASGTLDAAIEHLRDLRDLGVTTVELMPVNAFPGARNWGYDGVFPYAVQESYGGPKGLQRFVDACHACGLAVALDVVHNHLGPEGNVLADYGPYFTDRYRTPWGAALNFDGPFSHEVRRYFIESAIYFLTAHHIDVFRLDALHAIVDDSALPFVEQLAETLHARARDLGRRALVIGESDRNDPRLVRPPETGGLGLDAHWADDTHHALHALLTGERTGYYEDFGELPHLARALRDGYAYAGQYSPYRKRPHGRRPVGLSGERFVVALQNHDQVGNRALGDRLTATLTFEQLRLAACALLLSPFVPLLFMGEEYGERAPFLYFTNHNDADLGRAVARGRRAEFAAFGWQAGDIPDPQDGGTFERSRLDRSLKNRPGHRGLRALYAALLKLRRDRPALRPGSLEGIEVIERPDERALLVRRRPPLDAPADEIVAVFAFGDRPVAVPLDIDAGPWTRLLDSEDTRFDGSGNKASAVTRDGGETRIGMPPHCCVVLARGTA